MEVDSDSSSSSSSDCNDEEIDKFKEDELKKKIEILENKVNYCILCIIFFHDESMIFFFSIRSVIIFLYLTNSYFFVSNI